MKIIKLKGSLDHALADFCLRSGAGLQFSRLEEYISMCVMVGLFAFNLRPSGIPEWYSIELTRERVVL